MIFRNRITPLTFLVKTGASPKTGGSGGRPIISQETRFCFGFFRKSENFYDITEPYFLILLFF